VDRLYGEIVSRDKLLQLITKRPWLLPVLYHVYSYGEIDYGELKQILGIRGPLLKRALWWLVKYGIIKRRDSRFRVSSGYRGFLEELFLNRCIVRRYYVFRIGMTYIVVVVRRTRISTYTVPSKPVEELSRLEANAGAKFTVKDLVDTLGISSKLAYRVIKTHDLLRECVEKPS